MTEEVKPQEDLRVQDASENREPSAPEAPQYTEIEQQAMEHGWRPEAEFDTSTGKKWKSAEQFMELKPLFDKIDAVTKENKTLRKGMESLGQHYKKVEQSAYQRALADLKAQRTQALEEGDLVRAEDLRDQIDEVKEQAKRVPDVVPPPQPVEMDGWKARNKWYSTDEDMTMYADQLGNRLIQKGMDPQEILETVEKKTREAFPHKFRNPNKETAPVVEGGSRKKSNSAGDYKLTADEARIMQNLIRAGAPISEADYIRDLKKAKGL